MGRRPFKCYRTLNKKAYIKSRFCRGVPESKLAIHDLGNRKASAELFPMRVNLISLEQQHISSEALESARVAANKFLVKSLGKDGFHCRVCPQPLNILRINKMLTCAGADRLQTGMRNSFGKPYGRAARIFVGQHIMNVRTKEGNIATVKDALRRAKNKLPGRQVIQESERHGFTGLSRTEFVDLKEKGRLLARGSSVSVIREKGNIEDFKEKCSRAI